LVLEIGSLPAVCGILMPAHVVPWPAVEIAFADPGYVIGHQIIAKIISLIGRAPHVGARRIDRKADTVAQPGSKYPTVLAFGGKNQNVGAFRFRSKRCPGSMFGIPSANIRGGVPRHVLP